MFNAIKWNLMVSSLVSRSISLGTGPIREHSFLFLGKTLHSHSASLHPGAFICTGEFIAAGEGAGGEGGAWNGQRWTSNSSRGE